MYATVSKFKASILHYSSFLYGENQKMSEKWYVTAYIDASGNWVNGMEQAHRPLATERLSQTTQVVRLSQWFRRF